MVVEGEKSRFRHISRRSVVNGDAGRRFSGLLESGGAEAQAKEEEQGGARMQFHKGAGLAVSGGLGGRQAMTELGGCGAIFKVISLDPSLTRRMNPAGPDDKGTSEKGEVGEFHRVIFRAWHEAARPDRILAWLPHRGRGPAGLGRDYNGLADRSAGNEGRLHIPPPLLGSARFREGFRPG